METSTLSAMTTMYTREEGVLSDSAYNIVEHVAIVMGIAFTFTGIITNTFNIKTFIAVGTDDAVTVSFMALSISDLVYSVAAFVTCFGMLLRQLEVQHGIVFSVNPFVIFMISANITKPLYCITELTTTFLAVVRCLCVVRPLHFKNMMTKRRSLIVHVFFAVFSIAWHIPVLSQMATVEKTDPRTNRTRVVLWMSPYREEIKDIVAMLFDSIIGPLNQVLLIISIIVMTSALKKSVKFRQSSTTEKQDDTEKEDSNGKLTGKELQIVRQVILIASIYMACAIPDMVTSLYSLTDPNYEVGKRDRNLYFALYVLNSMTETFNSATTMFIYLKYNSKYRAKFWSVAKRG